MTAISPAALLQMRSAILQQNSALQKAANAPLPQGLTEAPAPGSFGATMQDALAQVNRMQGAAESASTAYEKGENTDIAAVMLAREQASVGFQATLQVRNKLLAAYKDIMSMPV